jgi:hypothetical protein
MSSIEDEQYDQMKRAFHEVADHDGKIDLQGFEKFLLDMYPELEDDPEFANKTETLFKEFEHTDGHISIHKVSIDDPDQKNEEHHSMRSMMQHDQRMGKQMLRCAPVAIFVAPVVVYSLKKLLQSIFKAFNRYISKRIDNDNKDDKDDAF